MGYYFHVFLSTIYPNWIGTDDSFINIRREKTANTCFHKTHPGSYDGTVSFGFTVVSLVNALPVYSGFSSWVVMK